MEKTVLTDPSLSSVMGGWGPEVFSAYSHWWIIPLIAPHLGALLGAGLHLLLGELFSFHFETLHFLTSSSSWPPLAVRPVRARVLWSESRDASGGEFSEARQRFQLLECEFSSTNKSREQLFSVLKPLPSK